MAEQGKAAIFISYRRSDTAGHAGRLWDNLQRWFDRERVFYDQGRLESGDDFPEEIDRAVHQARVCLVVIGPDWPLDRLHDERDFVRREIALALERRQNEGAEAIKVIPVLLGGAAMPAPDVLPEPLRKLCDLDAHAFVGKEDDYQNQFRRLLDKLALPGMPEPRYRAPSGLKQPRKLLVGHVVSPHFADPQDKLAALRRDLEEAGRAAVVASAAVHGMGGVGKTQLALKYSQDHGDEYAGVWWFRAERAEAVEEDCQECCKVCGVAIPDQTPPHAVLARWLEDQPRWLLVYDNAEDPGTLRDYVPQKGGHHVIVTSRNPAWGGLARPVDMQTWDEAAGVDFLTRRLGHVLDLADKEALPELARWLGGLPLALEQAGAFLENTRMAVAEYLALLRDVDLSAATLEEGRPATGYERSVIATLAVAFPRLSEPAQWLLRLCGFLAPEPIPERLFREHPAQLPEPLAEAVNGIAWDKVVAELLSFGLAERPNNPALDAGSDEARTEKALSFHRLTQEAIRAKLADPEADCAAATGLLRVAYPQDARKPVNWPRCKALAPHVQRLDAFFAHGWVPPRQYSWLLDRLATYLRDGPALYQDAISLFRRGLEIDQDLLGDDHPDTLGAMNNLASTLLDKGDLPGAQALQEKVLDFSRRVLGEDHPNTLTSMNNLAGTLRAQGDLPGARALQEKALDVRRRVLGEEHPDTLTSMNNLAGTLRAQGDLPRARALQEKELGICRRVLGEEHPDTLTSMNNLAGTLRAQGDLPGARTLQEKTLEVRRRALGEEHPSTTISAFNLFGTLFKMEESGAAIALFHDQLAWLLERDPASLGADQRNIQAQLASFFRSAEVQPNGGPPPEPRESGPSPG